MIVIIEIPEDVFTRLFDVETEESPGDQEAINTAIRKGTVVADGWTINTTPFQFRHWGKLYAMRIDEVEEKR